MKPELTQRRVRQIVSPHFEYSQRLLPTAPPHDAVERNKCQCCHQQDQKERCTGDCHPLLQGVKTTKIALVWPHTFKVFKIYWVVLGYHHALGAGLCAGRLFVDLCEGWHIALLWYHQW